jgi:excisionase family DNA binding protein
VVVTKDASIVQLLAESVQRVDSVVAANRVTASLGSGSLRHSVMARGASLEEVCVIVGFRLPGPDNIGRRAGEEKEDPWLLTPRQCAARLNISRAQLYKILASPNGPRSIKIGRSRRIRSRDLDRWVEEQLSA